MGLDNTTKVIFKGRYTVGAGKAYTVCQTPARQAQIKELFNCNMVGTFNILLDRDCTKIPPMVEESIHRYNLVKITEPHGDYTYGWSYRWEGSSIQNNKIEVYTKNWIDDKFKNVPLKIQFLKKLSDNRIRVWQEGKYWFQGFPWLTPKNKRANSLLVWNHLKNEDYSNKTVLDFGCHYGFFSFHAAKAGAKVIGIDKKIEDIRIATFINDNIELTDAKFSVGNAIPVGKFDYIFNLSVFHWIDPTYSSLPEYIRFMKSLCKTIYLELINPPLEGTLTEDQVDKMVGGDKLKHYQHNIRKTRTIYRIKGEA